MSDRKILDKYVDLEKSCMSDSEKKQVMDMSMDVSHSVYSSVGWMSFSETELIFG